MPEMPIRAFVAVPLPDALHQNLDMLVSEFKNAGVSGVRWVPLNNIHLTLKFLGEITDLQRKNLTERLAASVQQFSPIDISIGGIGAFPNPRRARVVWVGVQAPAQLARLQQTVEKEAAGVGIPPEERPFSPHLTIARVTKNVSQSELERLAAALSKLGKFEIGRFTADHINLYRSELRPQGAVYTRLAQFGFQK